MVQFENYIGAGYPALWVQTHEEDRAVAGLAERVPAYGAFVWDLVAGLRELNQNSARQIKDPKIAVEAAAALPEKSVLFLKDFHRFIGAVETLRTVKNILPYLKSTCRHIAFVSPVVQIPVELQKEITVIDFGLPSTQELMKVARRILEDCELSGSAADERVIEAARGLTLAEAEDAFALSLLMKKEYSREILESQKLQIIKKSGLMELYQAVPESQLGGHDRLKRYVRSRKRGFEDPGLPTPRGILIVGPPGCGKTLSVKVIAAVLGFPLIRLDMAGLKGSLVGQSEERMRQATALIDAVSPCVVLFDELEKSIGGVQSSNRTDGGTSAAMFGHLLTWMLITPVLITMYVFWGFAAVHIIILYTDSVALYRYSGYRSTLRSSFQSLRSGSCLTASGRIIMISSQYLRPCSSASMPKITGCSLKSPVTHSVTKNADDHSECPPSISRMFQVYHEVDDSSWRQSHSP